MTARVEVYFPNGTLQFGMSNRLFRVLKQVNTGTSDGSTTVAELGQGTPVIKTGDIEKYAPQFSVSGTTVSWTFNGVPTADRGSVSALIGVY